MTIPNIRTSLKNGNLVLYICKQPQGFRKCQVFNTLKYMYILNTAVFFKNKYIYIA